jgi:hypothetical protein
MAKIITVHIARKTYTMTLKKTDTSEQILSVYYTDPDTNNVTVFNSTNSDQSITVKHGGTWYATAKTTSVWLDPGTISPSTSGTISNALSISISDAVYTGGKY